MKKNEAVPVIDLFAGPGGLGEGFSCHQIHGMRRFRIALSIEMAPWAHQTLLLRSFYRQFLSRKVPDAYYEYLRGDLPREKLFSTYDAQFKKAKTEAQHIKIGPKTRRRTRDLISKRVRGCRAWVLIGGPPCQAYSLVGRSRVLGADKRNKTNKYNTDPRHTLYKEYLRIIADHWPPLFVMENVRGLLSSKLNGEPMFPRILADLGDPGKALHRPRTKRHQYEVLSFVTSACGSCDLEPSDYVIRSEHYGLPQSRHRLILFGVRTDLLPLSFSRLRRMQPAAIEDVISDIPRVRSGLSGMQDGLDVWKSSIVEAQTRRWARRLCQDGSLSKVAVEMEKAIRSIRFHNIDRGGEFVATGGKPCYRPSWFSDSRLGGICNHTTRIHIVSDLHRYLFAACYAKVFKKSPVLRDYPRELLPRHRNVKTAVTTGAFQDRFKVQIGGRPATTITSHLAKDGHHFIHPDPTQCRSLTVREAARLQTFPDNYYFEGSRTAQYIQVGNAVPPLLASKIAKAVYHVLEAKRLI